MIARSHIPTDKSERKTQHSIRIQDSLNDDLNQDFMQRITMNGMQEVYQNEGEAIEVIDEEQNRMIQMINL